MSDPAIRVHRLSKSFRAGFMALKDVSLEIAPGEMVALIGASGSGKSTLLRHIAGLVEGDRRKAETPGRIDVLGRSIQERGRCCQDVRRCRADIGFIFQQFNLVSRLTLLTNVLLGNLGRIPAWRGSLGLFWDSEKMRAMEALARVGIAKQAGQRAATLSGGQQQRAAIARVMVQGARIVLADEPIASLDPRAAGRVMENLAQLNREDGTTILVSLHQVEYATRYCSRTIAMREGTIVYDGPSTALTPAFLEELYGKDSEELILGRPRRPHHEDEDLAPTGLAPALAMAGR